MDELSGADGAALPVAFPQRHPQRNHHQLDMLGGLRMPGHDALGEHVEDERDIHPPRPRSDVCEV